MGNLVFDFEVQTKPTGTTQIQIRESRFGDGYVQKVGLGLNGKSTNWNITVDGDYDEVIAARDFLDLHQGYQSFLWTPPSYQVPLRFTCKDYTENPHVGTQSRLTAVFEQVFFP